MLASVLAVSATTAGVGLFSLSSASAVSFSAGIYSGTEGVGSFSTSDGVQVYCTELGHDAPMGMTDPSLVTSTSLPGFSTSWTMLEGQTFYNVSVPELTGVGLRQLNYVVSRWGTTGDNMQAAAVQIAIWSLRAAGASSSYQAMLELEKTWLVNHGGADAIGLAASMIHQSEGYIASQDGVKDPIFHDVQGYSGQLSVSAGTTKLVLTNAIFNATGTNTFEFSGGAPADGYRVWTGVPPFVNGEWDRYYTVTVNGTYDSWQADSSLSISNSGGINQIMATGSGHKVSGTFTGSYIDPDTIWAPVLSSEVSSKFVATGQSFSDQITFGVAAGSEEWLNRFDSASQTKKYAPITAKGTLYGPYLSDPALNPSATPPVGAPVAATATVTTSISQGPGTYQVTVPEVSSEAGFYTWVWNIDFADQLPDIKNPPAGVSSLPVNYFFTDGFGQAGETQVTASDIRLQSKLSADTVTIGGSVTDSVTADLVRGGWLQTSTGRASFKLRGSVYRTDSRPIQQGQAPADAQLLTTTYVDVNAPATAVTSDPITIPVSASGFISVQWCLLDADQAEDVAGLAKEYCDDFGVPAETAQILRPVVSSIAQAVGVVGSEITDTAIIDGSVPSAGAQLSFDAYLVPVAGQPKMDSSWKPVVDSAGAPVLWSVEEIASLGEQAATAQPVAHIEPVTVIGPGRVTSAPVTANSVGVVYWVEKLTYVDSGTPPVTSVLHVGKAGVASETTQVVAVAPAAPVEPVAATPTALPHTGTSPLLPVMGVVGVAALLAGAVVLVLRRRRSRS